MTPRCLSLARAALAVAAGFTVLSARAADEPGQAKPAQPAHPNGPAAAVADMARMTAATGLEAVLFASEPPATASRV